MLEFLEFLKTNESPTEGSEELISLTLCLVSKAHPVAAKKAERTGINEEEFVNTVEDNLQDMSR